MQMKKRALLCILFAFAAWNAEATLPVIDYTHIAQDAANEVQNLARYVTTATKQTETALNTLKTYENTVLQVARFGDPAALRAIPGVSTIAELYQTYGQLQQTFQQLKGMTNLGNMRYNYNSILSAYSQPQWNGFQSLNGTNISPNPGLYQFPTLDYNVGVNVNQQLDQLEQKKKQFTQQRDQTLQSLQSATTASDVQKYHAALTALNAAIADVNHSEQQVYNRGRIQQKQNASAQQIYQASQAEQRAAAAYQGIDNDLSALPSDNFRAPILWGSSN